MIVLGIDKLIEENDLIIWRYWDFRESVNGLIIGIDFSHGQNSESPSTLIEWWNVNCIQYVLYINSIGSRGTPFWEGVWKREAEKIANKKSKNNDLFFFTFN